MGGATTGKEKRADIGEEKKHFMRKKNRAYPQRKERGGHLRKKSEKRGERKLLLEKEHLKRKRGEENLNSGQSWEKRNTINWKGGSEEKGKRGGAISLIPKR